MRTYGFPDRGEEGLGMASLWWTWRRRVNESLRFDTDQNLYWGDAWTVVLLGK